VPKRSRQQVCVLNEAEASAVERDGFLANCRNHRHWSCGRAIREIAAGWVRKARPKRIDARAAVVEIKRTETPEWRPYVPTICADRNFAGLVTMQRRTS
jgi:hypothetical protein